MADIIAIAHKLKQGEIFELKTPFVPAPILDLLKEKGYHIYTTQQSNGITTYITGS